MDESKNSLTRRQFMKTAGAAGLGSLVAGGGLVLPGAAKAAGQVPLREFGNTGIMVPMLSLGTMWDTENNQVILRQALALGVNYWDTAESYHGGRSEVGIGNLFERMPQARKRVFLVTKGYARRISDLESLLLTSLDKLRTDYVDLYFVHGIRDIDDIDPATKAWSEKMKAQGKIKLFGFSTHSNMEECLRDAPKLGWIDGIMLTYNYRIMHTDAMRRAVDGCVEAGIGLTAMKTQGGGPVRTDSDVELKLAGRFLDKGFTPEQAKLMAVWQNPQIASLCSQMPNLAILKANAAAAMGETKLSQGDVLELERFAQATRSCYCAGCSGICEAAMDGRAPVGEVMRYLMYRRSHNQPMMAREFFAQLPAGQRAELAGLDYAAAEAVCPQGLPIGRLMAEATRALA